MLKPNQTAKVKWCSRNKNRLVELGYEFTKMGDEIDVRVEHLSYGSPSKIVYICDYCGEESITSFATYNRGHDFCKKDACKKCQHLKSRDAFLVKYGVTNPLQVSEFNQKQRETCIKKYGVEYALQNKDILAKKDEKCRELYGNPSVLLNEEIANKKAKTCFRIYGCKIPTQNIEIQEKVKRTNIEKYGVEYASQSPTVKEKMRRTLRERYGVDYVLQYPEFAHKAAISIQKTLKEHGNICTSKAQFAIYELCKSIYGESNVELNKLLSSFALDVELSYKGQLIDIEYDGTHWHTDEQKDKKRDEIIKSYGYKVLRFRGKKEPPSEDVLINSIEELVSSSHKFKLVNVDV